MRKILLKLNSKVNRLTLALTAFAYGTVPALAQDGVGKQVIDESKSALKDLGESVVSLVQVLMALGAIIVLAMVIFKVFKGDREAAEKMAWWVGGLTIGFVLLTVVKNILNGVS